MERFYRNLIKGAGSIINLLPERRNRHFKKIYYRPHRNDAEALKKDWEKVSESLYFGLNSEICLLNDEKQAQ